MDEPARFEDMRRESAARPAAHIITLGRVREQYDDLLRAFTLGGGVVEEVAEFPALLARLSRNPCPDLVVLDWGREGGNETLRHFAESWEKARALLPGGNAATTDESAGTEPHRAENTTAGRMFLQLLKSVETLMAGAHARRDETAVRDDGQSLALGGLDLRFGTSRAFWKRRRVDLSLTEFRIVSELARAGGSDVSHRELYDLIKGEGFLSGAGKDGYRCNVRAAIKRIRQKFRLVDPEFAAIRSYHGFGYRWDEAARAAEQKKSAAAADESAECP
jgi:two-component system response regulator ChvI